MSATVKPVWVWLPGEHQPVRCGTFSLEKGIGTFHYEDAYKARADALALDPFSLPFNRSRRGLKETRQGGLFGVLRDASPEGFGLALLEQLHGNTLADPMLRLELSEGDSVGAVEVCDDVGAKLAFQAPPSEQLLEIISKLPPERASSHAVREVKGLQGTSLGGERPKVTVMHRGQYWIAKLQDRGDPPHAPLREFVAMRLARLCGINAAAVEFVKVGEREVLLVKRFDRQVDAAGQTMRKLYASAHTVLRLDSQTRGERQRSYVGLAFEIQRWCGLADVEAAALKRELWRRMAFNAICGNGDDHPRNHGLLFQDGRWGLSEAFDIAPYITFSGTLAMAITRDGSSIATTENLLRHSDHFAYEVSEAREFIEHSKATVTANWGDEQERCGYPRDTLAIPTFEWLSSQNQSMPTPSIRRPNGF
jgi:serine/threonine-protein kinase HipA